MLVDRSKPGGEIAYVRITVGKGDGVLAPAG